MFISTVSLDKSFVVMLNMIGVNQNHSYMCRIFEDNPAADPWRRRNNWSVVDSAEEAGKLLKAMMYSIRDVAIANDKDENKAKEKAMMKMVPEKDHERLKEIINMIEKPARSRELTPCLSIGSSAPAGSDWGDIDVGDKVDDEDDWGDIDVGDKNDDDDGDKVDDDEVEERRKASE